MIFDKQRVSLNLMDAYIQLLLAMTWQNRRTDGLNKLIRLRQIVIEKIGSRLDLFPSKAARLEATEDTLRSLQRMRYQTISTSHPWTTSPVDCDLKQRHTAVAGELPAEIATLVDAVQRIIRSNAPRRELAIWIQKGLTFLSAELGVPLLTVPLVDLILRLANQPGQPSKVAMIDELSRYQQFAERVANDPRNEFHLYMMAELKPQADEIHLEIDVSYPWADLAYLAKETSLNAVGIYGLLNKYEWVQDSHFSEGKYKDREIPTEVQERFLTHRQLHAMSLMMSGNNRDTQRVGSHIVNSQSKEVIVDGRKLSNSLVVIMPFQDDDIELDYLIGRALIRYSRIRLAKKARKLASSAFPIESTVPSISLLDEIPKALWGLVEGYGIRRKVILTKKDLMPCLAGLMAENIYSAREKNKPKRRDGSLVKTLEDCYALTVELLASHGFTYSEASLKKGRTRFRKKYLEKIPEILDLFATTSTGQERN